GDLAGQDLSKTNVEGTDPAAEIVRYAQELKTLGVELIVVPVPPKAAIYPDKFAAGLFPDCVTPLTAFLDSLKAQGVHTVDLDAHFRAARAEQSDRQLFCATDSHWSPYGAQLAAQLVAEEVKHVEGLKLTGGEGLSLAAPVPLEFHGDLLTDTEKATVPKETLPVVRVEGAATGEAAVLVLGDSHCQVFRKGGSMLTTGAGFIDHLSQQLAAPVDEMSTQASGGEGPRIEIARRTVKDPGYWQQRKVAIWLFTARELTQGRWKKIPALVQKK
ncbi:MAG: hypothetical protein KDK97_17150, partial [Verrucomicrobiales bacterium]|nr:hypothetical protein [Verrucomicrobiales bacterium]